MKVQLYPYIRAWGKMMGSYSYYINAQVDMAKKDGAPTNAIYYSDECKSWITFDQITTESTREVIRSIIHRQARFDHKYEPGAYGVCKRCGEEKH